MKRISAFHTSDIQQKKNSYADQLVRKTWCNDKKVLSLILSDYSEFLEKFT